jgi:cytochrome c
MAASLETNKALAALLTAGIIASGSGVISRILYHPSMPEENAYVIQVPEAATGQGAEATTAEAAPLPVLLAAASPEKGATEGKKCAACHSEEKGGPIKIGPPLWGVVGRDIASIEGFEYSEALRSKEGQWTFDNLYAFIHGPKDWAPGTKMAFAGIKSPEDRADLLVYLRTLADEPVPLPEATAAAAGGAQQAEQTEAAAAPGGSANAPAEQATEVDHQTAAAEQVAPAAAAEGSSKEAAEAGQQTAAVEQGAPAGAAPAGAAAGVVALLGHADAAAGEKDAKKCAVCHSFEESGPAKIGPPLWGVVGRDIASVADFSYSAALTGKEGAWDYQNLDAFLSEPRGWAPGTKMAFAGLKKPEERADVILYLRSLSSAPAPLP